MLHTLIDLFLHLDRHLGEFVAEHGASTYGLLFLIVFLETGVVVTPFLPGDSLLFACGALAATGALDPLALFGLLVGAALLGDNTNYWIGRAIGPRAFTGRVRFLKREHLLRTQAFYERHGGKTIFFARFVPIVRTFAPFVAGVGSMFYPRFLAYSVIAAVTWVGACVAAGYAFGNIPIVKNNFSLVVIGIVAVSLMPIAIEWLRHRRARDASL
ncbi:MAG TPA: DedA family protein [Candidatus Polarisedimenticolaceae bacterium]|nr:DedA family protein [Candidatus Polarisedimenticolaceae bacterium]